MSYVSQQFLLCDASSLANFKNWAQAISTALSSSGWTQTADTGQVNWGTIVSVPALGSFVYEIWQPADSLQTGSTKYYLKMEYGKSSASGPRFRLTLSTSTDGAGTLNGITTVILDPQGASASAQGSVLTYDCYFSGDVDRFGMIMWRSAATSTLGQMLAIERTRNTDGTISSDGVSIVNVTRSNASRGKTMIVFGVGIANMPEGAPDNNGYYIPLGWDSGNASGAFNNNIPVFPEAPIYGKVGNPMTEVAWVHSQDVAEACVFTTTLYGATRTYIATNFAGGMNISGGPTNLSASRVCMRYD